MSERHHYVLIRTAIGNPCAEYTELNTAADRMGLNIDEVRHFIEEKRRCDTEFFILIPLEPAP